MDIWSFFTNFFQFFVGLFSISGQCPEGFVGDKCEIECGVSFSKQNQKIVGGSIATPHSWPSIVPIGFWYQGRVFIEELNDFIYVNTEYSFMCGGSLIDKTTVLTAAHCIIETLAVRYNSTRYEIPIKNNDPNQRYFVYLGVHDRSLFGRNARVEVNKIIKHEFYNPLFELNDIALFKLSKPATLSDSIQVACLPKSQSENFPPPNQPSYAAGWGLNKFGDGNSSLLLKNVKLTIYNETECQNVSYGVPKNWKSQICSGELEGGKDTCQGDSGGPLYVQDTVAGKLKYVVAGITSYGDGCALPGLPGIYTRTSAYINWINKNK